MLIKNPLLTRRAVLALLTAGGLFGAPQAARAYQVDCAILICLAGGWPSSTECRAARAEFIRRITPWPVEPPLQIWNCPLGVSFPLQEEPSQSLHGISAPKGSSARVPFKALLRLPSPPGADSAIPSRVADYSGKNGVADIDISGAEYDFVRSIRVYNVEYARQHKVGGDNDTCHRSETVRLGTYGLQGEFAWSASSVEDLPRAFEGLDGWGSYCPSLRRRAVFIDWTDYQGQYGYEQVDY